jgi:HSP20 family protein
MLTTWDAVSALNHMFDDVVGSAVGAATNSRTFSPDIDVRSNDEEILVVCDVPGIRREDLDITLESYVLTIKGSRPFDIKENERIIMGRGYGSFVRQLTLPDSIDHSNLSATLKDGVLSISIPKQASAKPIKIQVGNGSDPKQLKE